MAVNATNVNPPPVIRSSMSRRRLGLILLALAIVIALGLRAVLHRADSAARAARASRFVEQARLAAPSTPPTTSPVPSLASPTELAPIREPVPTAGQPDGSGGKSQKGDDLFTGGVIPRLLIEIPDAGMQSLRRSTRRYVLATVREGDTRYTNVAIHLKGSAGSFRPVDSTPSFTLNFDKFAEGQRFHGLKKIHLNSSIQDRSFLAEMIGRELFNAAGVPTPRAGHSLVSLNGAEPRVHVLLEGINRQFLKQHFKDVTGNVYDGHSQRDVTQQLPTNDGDEPGDQTRLRALAAAAREPELDKRQARLESTLDVDRFLTFVAMEAILGHWDGYVMNRNNFRIFHDRAKDRMVFLPHGMDQILNRQDSPVFYPRASGLVAASVLEVPEFRQRYRERVAQLVTNVIQLGPIQARMREVARRLDALFEESNSGEATELQRRVATLDRRLQQRVLSLERQLSPAPLLATNGGTNSNMLDWRPRVDLGDAKLDRQNDDKGNSLLTITTSEGCTASWRTRSRLSRGQYRVEMSMRTSSVVLDPNDPRSGVGLRISRQRVLPKNSGDRGWTPVNLDFQVQNDEDEVELICELRANQGTVWFDQGSLKLKRL